MTITGLDAIEYAEANDLTLCKYADPTEDAREGVMPDEARKIAMEDSRLIWLEIRDLPKSVLARWDSEDWDDDTMTASHYSYEDDDGPIDLSEAEAALYTWGQTEDNSSGGCQRGELKIDGQ